MFKTQFCGSDYKFVISWDNDVSQCYAVDESIDYGQNLFYKLNELYDNISKFTTEFVDCVRRVPNSSDAGQVYEINPNMSFKIENLNDSESNFDEVFALRKEVEKLKNQKEQIEIDYKNCMLRNSEEISKLQQDEEAKIQKLENKYKMEMSDLRIYFENSYTDYLKQLTEVISNQYIRSKTTDTCSTSENETGNENFDTTNIQCYDPEIDQQLTIRDHACMLEVSDESKIKIKENINKDLKNIIKAYHTEISKFKTDLETRKNDEMEEMKRSLKIKYASVIETLQAEVNQLLYNKALEDKVKEVHSILKEASLVELNNMQNDIDQVLLEKVKNERNVLEQELKSNFQNQLNELSNEWKNKFEELLSDIIVDSAVKKVNYEINHESHCDSTKKFDEVSKLRQLTTENEYSDELDQIKTEYEDRIQLMVLNFEQNTEKLNCENERLLAEMKELHERNNHLRIEIENLKATFVVELKTLQSSQDIDVEKLEMELNNIRKIHDAEVTLLKEENSIIQKKLDGMLERDLHIDYEKRSKIMSQLFQEIEDLIVKEENGDCITWPSDLANLELLFLRKFRSEKSPTSSLPDLTESNKHPTKIQHSENELSLDDILQERDSLRRVNTALHGVVKVFTKYLTNCEEELNNTLINELLKNDRLKRNSNNSFDGDSLCDMSDMNFEECVKKVHFAPDISELLTSLRVDLNHDLTSDRSVSVLESELNLCLERLKNEAAAVLCLTTGKKSSPNELISTDEISIQTDLNHDQLKENEEKIRTLENGLSNAEKEIIDLTKEIARLTEKINCLESIECYGDGFNASASNGHFQNNVESGSSDAEHSLLHYSDEYCPKCDKIIEEAKKEIEDRQAQVQAADNKLKSLNQFLERQTTEREHERSDFDKKIKQLQELLREQERDFISKYETEITHLLQQHKKLTLELEQSQNIRENLETKVKSYQTKIVKSREFSDDLETKIGQKSELCRRLETKLKEKEEELSHFQKEYQILVQQLESIPEGNIKQLEELNEQHVITASMIDQVKNEIFEVEKLVINRTRELENMYLPVLSSSIISSPSEDVSVCDRIAERTKLVSPCGSDLSSPIHIPINQLSCLHDKLKRLFRAEEAALKKIQDQNMEINKLTNSLNELELENSTLAENLSTTSAKLSEVKTELNNWQHGHSCMQSEIQLELSRTIESLESEIEYLKKCIDQKDEKVRELTARIENLEPMENTVEHKTREFDLLKAKLEDQQIQLNKRNEALNEYEKNKTVDLNKRLEKILSERDAEIKRLQQQLSSLSSIDGYTRNFTQPSFTPSLKRTRVSFEENSESFDDSDVSRNAVVAEISTVPHYLSLASSEMPLQKPDLNESLLSPHSVRFNEKLDVEHITSMYQESDSLSNKFNSKDSTAQKDVSHHRIKTIKRKLTSIQEDDVDGKDCSISLPKIPEISTIIEDQPSLRDTETDCDKNTSELRSKLRETGEELDRYKEQCTKFENQVFVFTNDVEQKSQRIRELIEELEKLETELEEKRRLIVELKKRDSKFENLNKEVIKERIEAQRKCEEYSRTLQKVEECLTAEQSKSNELSNALRKGKTEYISLQQKVTDMEKDLEKMSHELQLARENVKNLTGISAKLDATKYLELDSGDKFPDSPIVEHRTGSLRNLTEKVQKEVERAEEMDKNILRSLESDSRGASFIDELLKISSSLSENLKRILFRMLQEGPEGLTPDEKNTLIQSCGRSELDLINHAKLKDEQERHLRMQLEVEQKSNRELINENRKISLELNRSEMVLNYYDERMSFLVSKLDEYRHKAVKVEIELTSERTSRRQLEISFESYKKEMCDRQIQNNKKLDESAERLNMMINENVKLEREIDALKNTLEALTAELNSVKIITQYHSSSESDISRSLNPLKIKLNEVQEKYSRIKHELEIKKDELRELKSAWNLDCANHQKLENLYSVALEEKHELQQKLVDMKMKFDDLNWQKQKLDDKLQAAELYEIKRRMARISKDGNTKKEQELIKGEQLKLEKECRRLRENLIKINDQHKILFDDWKHVCEEMKIIFYRMLKAEKNQRCLTFQKIYLMQLLQRCRQEFITLTQSSVDFTCHTHDFIYFNINNSILTPKQKFKSIAFCAVIIHRIQFLMKRRISSNHTKMVNYFQNNLRGTNIYPWSKTSVYEIGKKELETRTQKLAMKSNEQPGKLHSGPEIDNLQLLYEQFTNLRNTYVVYGSSKPNP